MARTIGITNGMAYTHIGNSPRWQPTSPPARRPTGASLMVRTWLFDVDGCLVDSLTGTSLRPGAAGLRTSLGADRTPGARLERAAGPTTRRSDRLAEHGMAGLVLGCHAKRDRDADGRYVPPRLDDVEHRLRRRPARGLAGRCGGDRGVAVPVAEPA